MATRRAPKPQYPRQPTKRPQPSRPGKRGGR